ncbi:hypothetical protein CP967_33600 [Streptomyces nitrosporeus]|uniref:Calcium-binding protein n=1 Tax=Streptomyces nitrosporeus TaxID=28894 RepID=A0A5J6FMS0_9ACTN|nr:hypothetical protein [Streptomyces nitrosporeus]QEU76255.1 hypothetical protein CP967_33600 [Streptomyces nitrosporeus]GGZ21948.1 hypothetical protein GCM10010327_61160 [Streptomyces nitrosporeus]
MGKTVWRAVTAGGVAVAFAGAAAVPAGAAEGGVSFTGVAVNGGKPIVIGVKEEVEVHAVFRMTTKLKYDSGPTVFPYRGRPDGGDTLHSSVIGSDCEIVNKAKGICDFEEWLYIDPRHLDFGNEDAGTWRTAARVFLAGDAHDTDDENLPLQVKRATRVTVNASPEPVARGKTITVSGRVTRANWDTHTYQGYAGRTVSLQFKAAGTSSYRTVGKATSNSTGALKATVKATGPGTWRWTYYGNSTSGARSSTGDYVAVR